MKLSITPIEDSFINAYFDALDFTECGDTDQPPHNSKLLAAFERQSIIDCLSFYQRIECYLTSEDEVLQAGRDFWYTRNGHGCGFWDGDWDTYGDMFTKIAEGYAEVDADFQL